MQQADILAKKTYSMEKKGVWFIFCIVCHFFIKCFCFIPLAGVLFLYLETIKWYKTIKLQVLYNQCGSQLQGGGGRRITFTKLKQYLIFRTLPPNLSCPGGHILWDKEINHSDMVECVEEQSTCKVFNGKFLYNQGIYCSLFSHIKM